MGTLQIPFKCLLLKDSFMVEGGACMCVVFVCACLSVCLSICPCIFVEVIVMAMTS